MKPVIIILMLSLIGWGVATHQLIQRRQERAETHRLVVAVLNLIANVRPMVQR